MPFATFEDFADCVNKSQDKENPEAFCTDLQKQETGEWPQAVKSMVIGLVDDFLILNPEADVSVKAVETIIDAFSKWSCNDPNSFNDCVLTLKGKSGISDPKALCSWLHHEALGHWPVDINNVSPGLSGPIVVKSTVKRIVVGPVLIPGEADHEGESLSVEKIEDVAYQFMADFRYIDVAHSLKQVGNPVSSDLLRQPETHSLPDGSTLTLPKGTWMLGVRVEDPETWKQVESGAMKGFSIMGVSRKTLDAVGKGADGLPLGTKIERGQIKKILLSDLGDDWVAVAVSILPNPSVFKSKFIAIKEAGLGNQSLKEKLTRFFKRFAIKGNPDLMSDNNNNKLEETDMKEEEVKALLDEALKPINEALAKLAPSDPDKVDPPPADPPPDPDKADDDKDETPDPPPPADEVKAQVDKVAGELEAVKGTLADIGKDIKKLSAVKSQSLPQEGNETEIPTGPERDVFGRAKK